MKDYALRQPSYFGDSARSLPLILLALIVVAVAGGLGYLYYRSEPIRLEVASGMPRAIGQDTTIHLKWTSPHGARRVSAVVEQQGARYVVWEKTEPSSYFAFAGTQRPPGEAIFAAGKQQAPGLGAGKAKLILEAVANDLRGATARIEAELPVVLEKPRVTPDSESVSLRRGGTGVVAFSVAGDWSESGVRVDKYTFPSYAVKGQPSRRICMFGYPPDVAEGTEPVVYARNAAGDEATAGFPHYVTPRRFEKRSLELSDKFISRVVNSLDPSGSGSPPERYAKINSEMRHANDDHLISLSEKSAPGRLWKDAFVMLTKGKVESRFGDHRAYRYKGKQLNREWHLGVDLASVRNAPLPAANRGKVLLAAPLGIYGNCIVIDHGLRVQTVYGHLSQMRVSAGDTVERGQIIGNTGSTGMAGGDHVHVSLLLNGVFVDPVEWSFQKWMDKAVMPHLSQLE